MDLPTTNDPLVAFDRCTIEGRDAGGCRDSMSRMLSAIAYTAQQKRGDWARLALD
jgi:hypothetical protein